MLDRTEINRRARAALAHAEEAIEIGHADDLDEALEMGIEAYTADLDDDGFRAVVYATNDLARQAGILND